MSTISGEVLIHADPHEVFAVASDWKCWSDWFVGMSSVRTLTAQTRGTGAEYGYRISILGIPVPVETRIVDYVEGAGWRGLTKRGPRGETRWRFEPEGEGTRFSFAMDYQVRFLPAFLDRLLIRPAWERSVQASLQHLKDRVDQRVASRAGRGLAHA